MQSAVAFVSLFLGLVLGPQDVEVAVAETVTRVEILIDGRVCAELEGAPWKSSCDFGSALSPRHLQAKAYDESGEPLGAAVLWLNLPQPSADARLVLQDYVDGKPTGASVTWSSVTGKAPVELRVLFDGQLLATGDDLASPTDDSARGARSSGAESSSGLRFELPDYDADQLHFLRVEIDFEDNVTASAELTFGGFYTDRVNSELTALPVVLPSKRVDLPELASLQSWIEGPDGLIPVIASEKGLADVVVVMGGSAVKVLTKMLQKRAPAGRFRYLQLRKDERLFVGSPWAVIKRGETGAPYSLFPYTRGLTTQEGGYLWLLSRVRMQRGRLKNQRLADSLAVAGMTAASRNRRRAVVLLLGPKEGDDASQLRPDQVRGYLADLGVPLRVFSLSGESQGWGETIDVSTLPQFRQAMLALRKDLELQRTLWVAGTHLPQTLRIVDNSEGIVRAH